MAAAGALSYAVLHDVMRPEPEASAAASVAAHELSEKGLLAQRSSGLFSKAADEGYGFKANRGTDRTAMSELRHKETIQKAEPVIENAPGLR